MANLSTIPESSKNSLSDFGSQLRDAFDTTTRKVEVAGTTIPEGEKVLLFLGAANRDHRKFPEPERFDIRRRPIGHVAFGAGIHSCVGQLVARLEVELILTALLKRVNVIELADEPIRKLNNTLRCIGSLPVRFKPLAR
jgi:cytochrome P450